MTETLPLAVVQVRFLYSRGCLNAPVALELVRSVAADMGIPIELHKVLVESDEQATNLRFSGSPTVLVNGQDISPAARHQASYGLG